MPCQAAIDLATRAVEADVAGNHDEAMHLYSAAANELDAAARSTPSEAAEMRGKASEYRARVTVLQQKLQMEQMAAMASGAQMAQRAPRWRTRESCRRQRGRVYTVGGAAAVGAVAGAVLMGPITAVAAGAAAAYATTRKDSVGEVARARATRRRRRRLG